MRIRIVVLFLFYAFCIRSQESELYEFKIDQADSLAEITKAFASKKIHLIGGARYRSENYKIRNTYLHLLHKNKIYPKYILCEEGESICLFRNLYFETGDSTFLHYIEPDESSRIFYKNLREYCVSFPKEKRFRFESTDQESNLLIVHFAVGYLLSQHQEEYKKDPDFTTNYDLQIMLRVIVDKEDPTMWAGKFLKEDIENVSTVLNSRDSSILKKAFGENDFISLKKIIAGYELGKKAKDRLNYEWESEVYKQERETFLARNIYSLFVREPEAYYLGQFSMTHVRLDFVNKIKTTPLPYSFANKLNTDSLYPKTHDKIYSTLIYYNDLGKGYYYLNDKRKELDALYKGLPKGSLLLIDPKKTVSNNLLLFKE